MADKKKTARGQNPSSAATRFKAGAPSPNPSGRPKGAPNRGAIIRKVLEQVVTGQIAGQRKKLQLTHALLLKLSQDALAGDQKAVGMVLALWKESEESMERERATEYPFREDVDRQVIDEMYARMKASEA